MTGPYRATGPNPDEPEIEIQPEGNLRTLCGVHDAQVKETRDGRRSNNGQLRAIGCDASGFPLDPSHHWRKGERI